MRKWTRIFFAVITALISFTLFTGSSCDNGTGTKENYSIVGTWKMTSVTLYDTPIGDMKMTAELFLSFSGTGATMSVLRLNEDGTASVTTTYDDDSEEVVDGTWSLDGDILTIVGAGIDDTVTVDVGKTTMTLTLNMDIDFDDDGPLEAVETVVDMVYTRM